jgi:hypothetical protein
MSTSKNTNITRFALSAIWLDVMRMGQSLGDEDVDDVKWWIEHTSEIQFAFRILAALDLAEYVGLSKKKHGETGKIKRELQADGEDPEEPMIWTVTPSKALMCLYRKAIHRYLRERDKRLASHFGRR